MHILALKLDLRFLHATHAPHKQKRFSVFPNSLGVGAYLTDLVIHQFLLLMTAREWHKHSALPTRGKCNIRQMKGSVTKHTNMSRSARTNMSVCQLRNREIDLEREREGGRANI